MATKRTKAESNRGKFGVVISGFETNRTWDKVKRLCLENRVPEPEAGGH